MDGEDKPKTVPLEDVASIIITSISANIHSHLLLEAAKHGIALIICESFKPVSLVLPANRSTDTLLTRAQIDLSPAASRTVSPRKRESHFHYSRPVGEKLGDPRQARERGAAGGHAGANLALVVPARPGVGIKAKPLQQGRAKIVFVKN